MCSTHRKPTFSHNLSLSLAATTGALPVSQQGQRSPFFLKNWADRRGFLVAGAQLEWNM